MSALREAAHEALFWMEKARLYLTIKERMHPDGLSQYDSAIDGLFAALAQPETAAEPVAWLNRHHAAMVTQDHATAVAMGFTTPLYTHPPRDEWRLASEPPDSDRMVLVSSQFVPMPGAPTSLNLAYWNDSKFIRIDGHTAIAYPTHWRDVQPPTEGAK